MRRGGFKSQVPVCIAVPLEVRDGVDFDEISRRVEDMRYVTRVEVDQRGLTPMLIVTVESFRDYLESVLGRLKGVGLRAPEFSDSEEILRVI